MHRTCAVTIEYACKLLITKAFLSVYLCTMSVRPYVLLSMPMPVYTYSTTYLYLCIPTTVYVSMRLAV